MVISHRKKFVFIHIYKTGGTSITDALMPYARPREKFSSYWYSRKLVSAVNRFFALSDNGNRWINGVHKHATAMEIKGYLGARKFDDYFKFAFVRNPFDLQVSLYHYVRRSQAHRDHAEANRLAFREFVLRQIEKGAPLQSDFLKDETGATACDYIGKTEQLESSMEQVFKRIGIPCSVLHHQNRSMQRDKFAAYYDNMLAEAVGTYYTEDFERFGYSKRID